MAGLSGFVMPERACAKRSESPGAPARQWSSTLSHDRFRPLAFYRSSFLSASRTVYAAARGVPASSTCRAIGMPGLAVGSLRSKRFGFSAACGAVAWPCWLCGQVPRSSENVVDGKNVISCVNSRPRVGVEGSLVMSTSRRSHCHCLGTGYQKVRSTCTPALAFGSYRVLRSW